MIAIDSYLNQLISKRHSSKIKIITGLRRSGKSYLLSEIYKKYLLDNEYDALLAVPGSFKKIMVINKPIMFNTNDMGILAISLEDFLINQKSLDL